MRSAWFAPATILALAGCFDFTAEPYGGEGQPCFVEGTCADDLLCGEQGLCIDPCTLTDCSGRGTCFRERGRPRCRCDEQYVELDGDCIGPGQVGELCLTDFTCDGDLFCDGNAICIECEANVQQACAAGHIRAIDSCGRASSIHENCGVNGCVGADDICLPPSWNENLSFQALGAGGSGRTFSFAPSGLLLIGSEMPQAPDGQRDIYLWSYDVNASVTELVAGSASGGGISASETDSIGVSAVQNNAGVTYAAWLEETRNDGVDRYYRPKFTRYVSGSWEPIDCTGASEENIDARVRVAVSPDGAHAYLAWIPLETTSMLWEYREGNCESISGGADWLSGDKIRGIAVGPDNVLKVGGQSSSPNELAFVSRRVSNQWQRVVLSDTRFSPSYVTFALDKDGDPIVALLDPGVGNGDIFAFAYENQRWRQLGGNISNTANESSLPEIIVDDSDSPLVVWTERVVPQQVYIKRWNGRDWVGYGDLDSDRTRVTNGETSVTNPALATILRTLCVLWREAGGGLSARCTH